MKFNSLLSIHFQGQGHSHTTELLSDGHEVMLSGPQNGISLGARMAGPPPKNSWDCQFPTTPLTQRINDIPITLRTIPVMVVKKNASHKFARMEP